MSKLSPFQTRKHLSPYLCLESKEAPLVTATVGAGATPADANLDMREFRRDAPTMLCPGGATKDPGANDPAPTPAPVPCPAPAVDGPGDCVTAGCPLGTAGTCWPGW